MPLQTAATINDVTPVPLSAIRGVPPSQSVTDAARFVYLDPATGRWGTMLPPDLAKTLGVDYDQNSPDGLRKEIERLGRLVNVMLCYLIEKVDLPILTEDILLSYERAKR